MVNAKDDPSGPGVEERMEAFRAKCSQKGLKITPQRLGVFKILIESDEHPSAEALFRRVRKVFPNISLDTVNRTLLMFNEIGVASVAEGSGGPKRYEGNLQSHHHFMCVKCRKISDFSHEPFDETGTPKSGKKQYYEKISRSKVLVLKKTIYLQGICAECLESSG
jgi:Fur family peroxide stress response transcriptional regulator